MPSLLSININGLRDPVKRAAFVRWLHSLNPDLCCIQESHSVSDVELTSWFSASGYTAIASHGSAKSSGVIILYKRTFTLVDTSRDFSGRLVACTFDSRGQIFQLATLYAPNRNPERNTFLSSASDFLDLSLPVLLTGDFNAVLDPAFDRRGGAPSPQRESVAALSGLFSSIGCVDAWRSSHPGFHAYSWSNHDGSIASRIDTIACPADWFPSLSSCNYVPCPYSDHCAISCSFVIPDSMPRGPGYWKLNCSVLADPVYVDRVTSFWSHWRSTKASFVSQLDWWDEGKVQLKRLSIQFCSEKAAESKKDRARLESLASDLKDLIDGGQASLLAEYKEVLERIKDLDLKEAQGTQVRSRVKWVEEGETSSAFFCRLEKKRSNERWFSAIRKEDGTYASSLPEIMTSWKTFYENLFSSTYTDPNVRLNMLSCLESSLTAEDSDLCDGPITVDEALTAVKGMAHNKTPGLDGLPMEFYLTFWSSLGPDLVETFNFAFLTGHLSVTQRRGLISLLFKKGDRFDMKNWRPITLLCVDYKIASRVIAGRLLKVIGSVVSPDQSCGVPGRFIGENVALLRDVVSYISENNLPAAILSLDQEKAFDRVEWSFLFDCLSVMGFGPSFIAWIRLFYSLPQSAVLVNGYQSPFFHLSRGVRQGCPLSPLLYVLSVEVLACSLRADIRIKGISFPSFPNREVLLSQYADDMSIIVTTSESIPAVFNVYQSYELASGARVNTVKSKGLWLGSWAGRTDAPVDLQWSSSKLKTLGVTIGPGDLSEDNWAPRIEAVSNTLSSWRQRSLSFQGRLTVINILALSRIWYVASLIPSPRWVVSKLNTLVFSFFWNGKRDLVARKVVCQPKPLGGFGIVNVSLKVTSLHALWLKRLITSSHSWRFFLYDWFPDVVLFLRNPTDVPRHLPEFYKSVFSSWTSLGGGFSPSLNSLAIVSDSPADAIPINKLTAKDNYSLLLKLNASEPHCVSRSRAAFGPLYWPCTWKQTHLFSQDRPVVDIAWQIAHGVLYTAERLISFGYNYSPSCFCGAPLETLSHLFYECPLARSGLARIEFHLHSAVPVAPSIVCRHVLFGFSPDELLAVPPAFVYLLHLLKYYIWKSRNDFRFRNIRPSATDLVASIETRFWFNLSVFAHRATSPRARRRLVRLWGANGYFCNFDGDRLSFKRF